jgi:hypothetical protein
MKPATLILACMLCLGGGSVHGGDAVVVGYNAEGVWTTVTYYSSSTPKGGRDYKDAAQAREAALRDLRRRGKGELAREAVLADSDATGYVAVARGKTKAGKDVIVVGRGKSQADADREALDKLNRGDATAAQKIFYRYHSYGADAAGSF